MNGPLSLPSPPPAAGERVAEGRERGGGSWSQCALKMASSLPMNRRFVLVVVLVLDIPSRLGVFEDEYDDENEDDRFMVPMHVQERKEAFHERPPLPAPPQRGGSGGEGGRTRPGQ